MLQLLPGSAVGEEARSRLRDGDAERRTGPLSQHPAHFVIEHEGALFGVVSIIRSRSPQEPPSSPVDAPQHEICFDVRPEAWDRGLAKEALSAVLMQWDRAFPDEGLLHRTSAAGRQAIQLLEDCGFMEVTRGGEDCVEHRVRVRPSQRRSARSIRRVLLPPGARYPGFWAFWRGSWFERTYGSPKDSVVGLVIDSTRTPGKGWRRAELGAEGWYRYYLTVPRAEIEATDRTAVSAMWRGSDIDLLAVGPEGKASGWAEPSTDGGVRELLDELEAAGHSASLVEYRLMQVVVDAAELHDFRVTHHVDLTPEPPGTADRARGAASSRGQESLPQGRSYRTIPEQERGALSRLLAHLTDLAPSDAERIEVAHAQVSSATSTSMTAIVAGVERRLDAELYRYPRAAEHIPQWWLADL